MTSVFNYPCGIPGLNLSVEIYPLVGGDITASDTQALDENTNRHGWYTATTALAGLCWLRIITGSSVFDQGWALFSGGACIFDSSFNTFSIVDPLKSIVPGLYTTGQAGQVLGDLAEIITVAVTKTVTYAGVVPLAGPKLKLILGDDYYNADLRGQPFSIGGSFASWTGATVTLKLTVNGVDATVPAVSFDVSGDPRNAIFDIPKAISLALGVGEGVYSIIVVLATSTHIATVVKSGCLHIVG